MNSKVIVATILALASSTLVQADTYDWLTFNLKDGSRVAVSAQDARISYSEGILEVSASSGNQSFSVAELASMAFTAGSSGASETTRLNTGSVEILTLQGLSMGTHADLENAKSTLPSGIYVAKQKSKTFKVIF